MNAHVGAPMVVQFLGRAIRPRALPEYAVVSMDAIPASVMAAVAGSAAAGKNPWLPFALLFLLAAPDSMPTMFMDAGLHDSLHALGPAGLLYGLGVTFLVLSVLDSLADKLPFVERWLVPVSTAWRPFASIAVASLVAVAASQAAARAGGTPAALEAVRILPLRVAAADISALWVGTSVLVLSIGLGTVFGAISTFSKTGTRLLLSMVPLPALRLVHSFIDDLFALAVCVFGFAHAHSVLFLVAATLYLLVGLVTGPLLARLTFIHVRIGWSLVRKGHRVLAADGSLVAHAPPAWLARSLTAAGLDATECTVVPAYTYRAPIVGRVRSGWLVFAPNAVWFAARVMWRPRILAVEGELLARVGLAQTATARMVTLVDRTPAGGLREAVLYLYPAEASEIVPLLERAAGGAKLVRVRIDSGSAREALPGYAHRNDSVRYLPADRAGSLRTQALTTIGAALLLGLISGGLFVPIGAGYALSPHPRRFVLGLFFSAYLTLCVLGSVGLGWPAAVIYASLLNLVALRDLARLALKARVDGFVDKRAFLPPVCDRVWVPATGLRAPEDAWREGDGVPVTDGSWRNVVGWLDRGLEKLVPTVPGSGAGLTARP